MRGDVAEKVLRLRDALETVESINNQINELRKIFIVVLTVAVATLGIASILWYMWGTTYPQLYTMWVFVIPALIFFPLWYATHRLDKAAEVKGLYQDWDDKLREGELGVLAILESLDWDYVEYRVNRAKTLYPILLIIDEALWIAVLLIFVAPAYAILNNLLFNTIDTPALVGSVVLAVAIALAITWDKVVNKFKTLWSLDSLLWEVRWLYHESENFKPNLYVLARIIKALIDNGAMKRTNLAQVSGLSYDKLQKYLNWMIERGLVSIDGDGYVRLTKEGAKTYDELVQWIIKYVGSLRLDRRWRPRPT
jgi:predicted transcriptional regulator